MLWKVRGTRVISLIIIKQPIFLMVKLCVSFFFLRYGLNRLDDLELDLFQRTLALKGLALT